MDLNAFHSSCLILRIIFNTQISYTFRPLALQMDATHYPIWSLSPKSLIHNILSPSPFLFLLLPLSLRPSLAALDVLQYLIFFLCDKNIFVFRQVLDLNFQLRNASLNSYRCGVGKIHGQLTQSFDLSSFPCAWRYRCLSRHSLRRLGCYRRYVARLEHVLANKHHGRGALLDESHLSL